MSGTIPTQGGFLIWVRGQMEITTAQLPDDSPWVGYAFNIATDIVNQSIAQASPTIYMLAVYNLGGSNLLNFAPDQAGQTYFATARKTFKLLNFTPGLTASSSDESTSTSLLNQEFMKGLTLANLQNLKDPYGRQYLAFAQTYGPLWGLT